MSNRKSVVWGLAPATAVLLSLGSHPAMAQPEEVRLTPSDSPDGGGSLGISAAIDGNYLVVGAYNAAYVFKRESGSWVEKAKLLPSDDSGSKLFGQSVSISGDLILVGAPIDWWMGRAPGEAYVFRREGASWVQEAHFRAPFPMDADNFGWSVSISGDSAAVGAPYGSGDNVVYVYRRYDGTYPCTISTKCEVVGLTTCTAGVCEGVTWVREATLIPSTGDRIGSAVSINGDRVVVGADGASVGELEFAGTAYVFRRDGHTWTQEARLTASDGREGDYFGSGAAISEDYIVIGAKGRDDAYPADMRFDSGAAYVFRRDDNGTPTDPTDDSWVEQSKLLAPDGAYQDHFGEFVSISDNFIAIGASGVGWGGRGYVFRRARTSWVQVYTLGYWPVAVTCQYAAAGPYAYAFSDDCNENGASDGCEVPGDVDGDIDTALFDFGRLHSCLTGPVGSTLSPGCCFFDFELDDDVDLRDFRLFQLAFTGP